MRAGHIERAERGSIPGHALKLDNMKSLDAEVSLSAVTQEVVETVYYSFCCSKDKLEILRRRVDMILDIDQNAGVDWRCRIALGAWKRVSDLGDNIGALPPQRLARACRYGCVGLMRELTRLDRDSILYPFLSPSCAMTKNAC